MQRFIYTIIAIAMILSCSKPDAIKPEDVAAQTACEYYKLLIDGKYSDFVSGTFEADSLDSNYRNQLVDNAAMFTSRQEQRNKGIKSVEPYKATADTASHTATVFLTITFGNGNKENVMVQMIESKGVWYMR